MSLCLGLQYRMYGYQKYVFYHQKHSQYRRSEEKVCTCSFKEEGSFEDVEPAISWWKLQTGSQWQLVAAPQQELLWTQPQEPPNRIFPSEKGPWKSIRQREHNRKFAVSSKQKNWSVLVLCSCVGVWGLVKLLDERRCSPWGDMNRGVVTTAGFLWYFLQISVQRSDLHPGWGEVKWRSEQKPKRPSLSISKRLLQNSKCVPIKGREDYWGVWSKGRSALTSENTSPGVSLSSFLLCYQQLTRGQVRQLNIMLFFLSATGTPQQILESIKSDSEEPSSKTKIQMSYSK